MKGTLGVRLAFALILAVAPTVVSAKPPAPAIQLRDDDLLMAARGDIGAMKVEELRMLADTMAQCVNSLTFNELIQNSCDVARTRYAIEYGGGERALDSLLQAMSDLEPMLRRSLEDGKVAETDLILRHLHVARELRDTTNRAFYLKRTSPEPNQ